MDIVFTILREVFFWICGLIGSLLVISTLYLLGRTGAILRSGVEAVRILRKVRRSGAEKGFALPDKWFSFHTIAMYCIFAPPLLWIGFYIAAFFIMPVKLFLLSLLFLSLPVLGVLGVFTASSANVEDYFELENTDLKILPAPDPAPDAPLPSRLVAPPPAHSGR